MSRAKWKGFFLQTFFLKKTSKKKLSIWSRNSVITKKYLGKSVLIHNGQSFKRLFVNRAKIGYKFGEFIFTRKFTQKYKTNKKK